MIPLVPKELNTRETESVEVSGYPVELIWHGDPYHEYGGDYVMGWKTKIGEHQYGDLMGVSHIEERNEARQAVLEAVKSTIAAILQKGTVSGGQ